MSAGSDNFTYAVQERQRRTNAQLANPGLPYVAVDPGWDAYNGAMNAKRQQAAAAGFGFSMNPSGFGQDSGFSLGDSVPRQNRINTALATGGDPGDLADPITAKNWALSKGLSDLQAQGAASDAARVQAEAGRVSLAGDLTRSVLDQNRADSDRQAMDDAMRGPARDIVKNPDGSYSTAPASNAPPTRDQILAALPGHLQPAVAQYFDQQDAERAKTGLTNAQAAAVPIEAQAKAAAAALTMPVQLTDDAVDQNARQYLQTGVMPPMGMKDPGNRQRIMNRAAEISKGSDMGANIAANKASYKADSSSLTQLQKQYDAITSFESTARKNMDLFLGQAGKIVDTGSPLANTPARLVSGKMLGSPDQAAYEAARAGLLPEIAKIQNNPTLAGQLSDSARHEVESYNPKNATLGQTVAVMRILSREMDNRKSALEGQLATVHQRIAGNSAAGARQIGKYSVVVH